MFTLWFTGLPCSGKSTLAYAVSRELTCRNRRMELVDGDVIRRQWPKGLGFSEQDRNENVRRIAFGCRLLNKHGIAAVVAAVSPYRAVREEVRASIPNFVEVHVDASIDTCIQRDVKGLYRKALAGEIPDFTGIGAPYEPPLKPELVVNTENESPPDSVTKILATLERLSLIEPTTASPLASEPVARWLAVQR